MAVGIIIGAAFNKIVNSLVNDIIMPPIGVLIGGVDFKQLEMVIKGPGTSVTGASISAVVIRYGAFLNTVIEFLFIAFSVFIVVKFMLRIIILRVPKYTD